MKTSFVSSIIEVAANAEISFYDLIMARGYAEPATYALIILRNGH
jgi:hypothetical protein